MGEVETGDGLSASVGASGRRALRDLRFLWAVGIVTLLGCGAALLTNPSPGREYEAVEDGARELATLDAHDVDGALSLYQWLAQPDLMSPVATQAGTSALSAQTESAATWKRFLDRSAELPGEAALRRRYESLVQDAATWSETITAEGQLERLQSDPVARADLVSSSMDHVQERGDALRALRALYADELASMTRGSSRPR